MASWNPDIKKLQPRHPVRVWSCTHPRHNMIGIVVSVCVFSKTVQVRFLDSSMTEKFFITELKKVQFRYR